MTRKKARKRKPLVTVEEALAFMRVAKAHLAAGGRLVDGKIMAERAEVCIECEKRTELSSCPTCKSLVAKATFKVPYEFDFGDRPYCGVCSCRLAQKSWLLDEVNAADGRPLEYPDQCWVG